MRADRFYPAVLQKDDLVQPFHGRDAVRDEQRRLARAGGFEVVEDDLFGAGVDRRDRVVENQDRRVFQQRAGDGDTLLLPAGNGHAALAQHGLVAVLEIDDVVAHIGQRGGAVNLFLRGIVNAEADVVGDGVREQKVILRHVGAGAAHRVDGQAVHVLAVDEEGAVGHIISAQQQVDQCRFARAGLAHDAHAFAGGDREADIPQHVVLAVRVAEGQMAELNAALGGGQLVYVGTVGHVDGRVEQLGNAVERRLAARGLFNQHRHGHDGPDDGLEVADVLHQLARVELPAVDEPPAVPENDADDRLNKQRDEHFQQGGDLGVGDVDLLVFAV